MQSAKYYREQADHVRTLLLSIAGVDAHRVLSRLAEDYDDIATDIETGAIEVRHADLMPQLKHQRR